MSVFSRIKLAAVVGVLALAPSFALAEVFTASLDGGEEVPANTTVANGALGFTLVNIAAANPYTLRYENLEGQITMAHIHIGQTGVNGGIMIWLCQTAASPAPAAVSAATP